MPSEVTGDRSWFDRFAAAVSGQVSRAWFFTACVLMIVLWAVSYPVWRSGDTYQLIINTSTTIITFLMVALLNNAQQRADQAGQHKLNAIAAGMASLMAAVAQHRQLTDEEQHELAAARAELCAAVGLEERESA
jgi:low affinity Fe/Cu permease